MKGAPALDVSFKASRYRIRLAAAGLRRLIQQGTLRVVVGEDSSFAIAGSHPGPNVGIRFSDWRTLAACALDPDLRVGEAYMDGKLTIESGTLADFLHLAVLNTDAASGASGRTFKFLRSIRSFMVRLNPARTARRFVAHHYDLEDELFETFLDKDLQYSCAYFSTPGDDLESAQARKKLRLAAKLLLRPGQRVLDIGSGWGGLAMDLARLEDVEVDGVTLSRHQHRASVRRASEAGLSDRVRFELRDYRDVDRTYDRIISVGMLEHVGRHNLDAYFKKVAGLLTNDGVAVVHAIGSFREPGPRQPWIERYIFPGQLSPAAGPGLSSDPTHSTDCDRRRDSCDSTTRKRSRHGDSDFTRTASGSARSTTSASSACGTCILPAAKWSSVPGRRWSFRSSSHDRLRLYR